MEMTEIVNSSNENFNSYTEEFKETNESVLKEEPKSDDDAEIPPTETTEDGEADDKLDSSIPANGYHDSPPEKRQRKQVQRLSETLNRAHEAKEEERAKAAKEVTAALEAGKGMALGDIPLIEATIRKTKPVDLKVLHLIIYGRSGSATEIRSNLRKFRGFGFPEGSEHYTKKCAAINLRSAMELREALRILNLEVSGTREQLASRIIEFLRKPSASMVKYKGKVVKKSGSRSHSKKKRSPGKVKRKSIKGSTSSIKTTSSEASVGDTSHADEDSDIEKSSVSSLSEPEDNDSDVSFESGKKRKTKAAKKNVKKREPTSKMPTKSPAKRVRKVSLDDSEDEEPPKKIPVKAVKQAATKDVDSEDEDTPLSTFALKKLPPSDEELKKNIISLLKTVNLEETSLKVVREKIFSQYPGIDLSGKKEFINTTVKEFLSQS